MRAGVELSQGGDGKGGMRRHKHEDGGGCWQALTLTSFALWSTAIAPAVVAAYMSMLLHFESAASLGGELPLR